MPATTEEHGDREDGEHDTRDALPLEDRVRERVVPFDEDDVARTARAEHGIRIAEQQRDPFDDRDERDRAGEQRPVDASAQASAREREDEVQEADEVDALERGAEGEERRVVRVREEGREPGEPDEHHCRAEPVPRALAPRDQAACDVRPADEHGEGRVRGLVRLEVSLEREPRCGDARRERGDTDRKQPCARHAGLTGRIVASASTRRPAG